MNEFWEFARDYWWLAFPILGMASGAIGGIHKAMERSAKRRHERRLEMLRVKGEIQAAQLAARGVALPPQQPREPVAGPRLSSQKLLEKLFAENDEITARWLDYELDVAKLIAFPAMSDGRQPLTAAFLRAKKTADTLRPAAADAKISEAEIAEYLDAVGDYAVAFEVAERDARRMRDSGFTEGERKRLDRAQHMLKVALDEAATQSERQVAYKRVRDELDGLIVLSDEAVQVLEKKVAGELPMSRYEDPAAEAPAPPASTRPPAPAPTAAPESMRLRRNEDRP